MDPEATRGPTIGRRAVIAGAVGGLGLTLSGPTLTGLTSTGLTPSSWWRALARAADEPGGAPSPSATRAAFTDLGPADALGVRVPAGFEVSLVGRSGESVAGTGYRWHDAPDGGGATMMRRKRA